MPFKGHFPYRRSVRLSGRDYARGAYFVTICTWGKACLFGVVVDGEMRLNAFGTAVAEAWAWLGATYDQVTLDAWVIMPNHVHGVLMLEGPGAGSIAPARKPLGSLVGAFKATSTRRVNLVRGDPGATLWQRGYYEHSVRDAADLDRIRRYIDANPANWPDDEENPINSTTSVPSWPS
jgi:REP element-mobilizing transposase RayT